MKCEYCGREIPKGHPRGKYTKDTISEDPRFDSFREKDVCQSCFRDLVADMMRYKPGKLYIE